MFTVLDCIAQRHDLRLVAGAMLLCLIASAAGLGAYHRATQNRGALRLAWISVASLSVGGGVWATHFLAMLAYQPGMAINYQHGLTSLSLLMAIASTGVGLLIAARSKRLWGRLAGGGVVGAGIAAMHFIGVSGMILPARLIWEPDLVAAAIAIAALCASASLAVAKDGASMRRLAAATGLLVLGILGLHFTAMSAVILLPDAAASVKAITLDRRALAVNVAVVATTVALCAAAMLAMARFSAGVTLRGLQSALDSAPSALAFFDRRQRLLFWNRAYGELIGTVGVEVRLGLPLADVLAAAERATLPGTRAAPSSDDPGAASDRAPEEFSLRDGRTIRAQRGPTQDGGLVVVLFDITVERRAERLADEARESAEAANRSKSEFLANMSHEIRTPLNGVLGMAQVMERHPLDDAQRERLGVIRSSGQGLLAVLNDILDLSKIESGRLELEDFPFDLEETLRSACAPFEPLAAQKDIDLRLTIAADAAGRWSGDALRLRQIVSNLVSNALKFTAAGEVAVEAVATGAGLRIAVRDSGIGVPDEQLPRLFEKFTQADASTTRRFGGTGLGLAICRDLAGLMGGELTAESVEGVGSTFTLEAPFARLAGKSGHRSATRPAAAPSPQRRVRILAAEDNPTNRLILSALLAPLDADITVACDGLQAVEAFKTGDFDVVLMDAQMPNMNGIEAAAEIRAWEEANRRGRTPILALTANVMTYQVETYLAAGMDGVVAKPIEAAKLFGALSQVLPGEAAQHAA